MYCSKWPISFQTCCSCLRKHTRSPYYRSFWFFVKLYCVIFCVFLPIFTFRLKYSCFYWARDSKAQTRLVKLENDVRKREAIWRVENERTVKKSLWKGISSKIQSGYEGPFVDNKKLLKELKAKGTDILITIISTRRSSIDGYDPKYLSQTVVKTVELYRSFEKTPENSNFFSLALCNVDPVPSTYVELNLIASVFKIPTFSRFSEVPPSANEQDNSYLKERNDYIFCLKQSLEMNPSYVLLLEDDGVPISGALHVLKHTVMNTLKYYAKKGNLGFVKFYHPYRFFNRVVIWELVGFALVFGTVMTSLHYLMTRDTMTIYFHWFFYVLLVLLIGVALGHANLLKMRHLSKHLYTIEPTGECCTPAMLFSNKSGHVFANYYDNHPCTSGHCQKDLPLRKFLDDTRSKGWMVMPNIFDHIGLYSVVNNYVKDPEIVN